MKPNATHYDRDCLRLLLDDALREPLADKVAEHVAECSECRHELESLAARPEWWSQACDNVRVILADPAAYSSSDDQTHPLPESDESFETDFAVDFLSPSDNPAMLGRLDDYDILEVIGQGGMGIVLKGYQRELNRYVAVKVLAPHLAQSAAARRRFEREAQATAAVVHPHVMAIHAVAANARLPYLVMPFVACESLQHRLNKQGPLNVNDVLRIGMQTAYGLAAAHAQGLVHRDVKPANILLETSVDRVMLTDFGLARAVDDATLTRTGIIAGTPQYMSPEQANGDAVDHRSDLFSLGGVLYAMCTGRAPFRAESTFGVLNRIREAPPRPIREINADIPDWLERIVQKLLSKSPNDRISHATEVGTLLEQCLAHLQQPTSIALPTIIDEWPAPPSHRTDKKTNREKFVQTLWRSLAFAVVPAGILFGAWWLLDKPNRNEQQRTTFPTTDSSARPSLPERHLQWNATQLEIDTMAETIQQLEAVSKRELADPPSNRFTN